MYGPGAPPPTRSAGTVITLRVLFTVAAFLSCGVLACLPLFRVAILRGRWFNWTAAWLSLPLAVVCFAVVGTVEENDPKGDIALALVMLLGALAGTYFLIMDIRPDNHRSQYAGYAQPQPQPGTTPSPPGYGYPAPSPSPYANMQSGPQPPMPHTPIPQPQAQPQRPTHARIDQVRAELDELSDYLRKHDTNGNGNGEHGGGR
ncbi:hypothetical protein PV396_36835 [Streptomyces sp. ME02-8801-2C]|uniref:hypothetical protein n=1 Tax=Streptomyces sp. ME02-8801-2C TaxID=3028680 RepID=UPI0029B153C2|nr:hypothetical protein [Streptomyces sp. ME02-8801-2C]MDX3457463.1 hypothetical protein [Streptomyces sp. ME02-8801-2C]